MPIHYKVAAKSWLDLRSGYQGLNYTTRFSLQDGGTARVELYIGGADRDTNKERFDHLESYRDEIESEVGGDFLWNRLEEKKASRIGTYIKGSILEDQQKLTEIRHWMVETLPKLKRAFDPKLASLTGKSS